MKQRILIVMALGLAAYIAPASSEGTHTTGASTRVFEEEIDQDRFNDRFASLLSRAALLDLGLQSSPGIEDYSCAQSLLSIALDADPTNADLARLLAEAAWSAGDEQTMLDATRSIVRSDHEDTVALLRLISANINKHQTVEDRLAAYARYLGPEARSIDPAVRSRLALDAALLERETGNADRFLRQLRFAQQLDPSNKDAVSLSAQIYAQQLTDPIARLNLQIDLLMADPLDPHVHLAIAKEFATEGLVVQARRFMDNAAAIYTLGGQSMPDSMREQRIALAWQINGPHQLLEQLNATLADSRAQASAAIEQRLAASEPTDDIPAPEEIRLDLSIDAIRLLAAHVIGDEEMVTAVLLDINRSTAKIQGEAVEATAKRTTDRNAVFQKYVRALLRLEAMRATVGREGEQMRQDAENLSRELKQFAELFKGIEPWILYSEGKYAQAIAGISPETNSVNNKLILGLAHEKIEDIDTAVVWYSAVSREYPLTAFGSFARSRMVALERGESIIGPSGRRMAAIEKTVPEWIDRMIEKPTTFIYLSVEPTTQYVQPMDNAKVRITMRNLAPIPMALGPSRPMESRFLITPGIEAGSRGFNGKPKPKVIELNRRLRLEPLEELSVVVEADSPYTDWLVDIQSFATVRGRWRVLQGFTTGPLGGLINSPFGLVTETPIVQRLPLAECTLGDEQILGMVNSPDGLVRRRAVRAIGAVLMTNIDQYQRTEGESQALVQALTDLYERAPSRERAEMLLVLPHANQLQQMDVFDERIREMLVVDSLVDQSDIDGGLLCAVLLTRVSDPLSPVFEAASKHSDQRVRAVGQLLELRLNNTGKSYATIRDVFDELGGEDPSTQDIP